MANNPYGTKTVCPFYIREAQKSITCEGIIPGTCGMTRFDSASEKLAYQAVNCESYDYTARCCLAAVLMEKYGKEGGESGKEEG